MSSGTTSFDWNQLLPARNLASVSKSLPVIHGGKTVLVTGAGGSIGSALVHAIAAQSPKLLILLDHSEQNLYEIETALSSGSSAPPFLAILRAGSAGTNCRAIRLGNVLGSHGSVVPLFLQQIARHQNLSVTHKDVTRYFLTMDETVNLIFRVASLVAPDGLFLPEMGQPVKIRAIAERLLQLAVPDAPGKLAIEFTGLRPGDKLSEDLLSPSESLEPTSLPGIHRISSPFTAG